MHAYKAQVQPVIEIERRAAERCGCALEATSHTLDGAETISWGAVVRDLSTDGIGLSLCFPFPPGTYLTVELHDHNGERRALLARVLHVHDQADGSWHLGCELARPLSEAELDRIL